jgi:beta-lactamase regulating signal transducer with metallopeptidase domain
MTLALLFASALRSAVLGTIVWSALKILRIRDSGTETIIWAVVLVASLLMPLMVQAVPTAIHLPLIWPHMRVVDQPDLQVALVSNGHIIDSPLGPLRSYLGWLRSHLLLLSWCIYALVTAAGIARLSVGLIFTARLYRTSMPVETPWANNRRVRSSNRITGPVSCGSWIILPEDYPDWSAKKLAAVLAHEQAHLDRGDFFIQLLAMLHRILFWFSPFAWWLQSRLAFLAEAASDEAAVRVLNDRACYAEVLLEMSQKARGAPLLVAMTKRGGVQQRILQILDDAWPAHPVGDGMRVMLVAVILPVAGLLAGARANIAPSAPAAESASRLLQRNLVEAPINAMSPKIAVSQLDTLLRPSKKSKKQPLEVTKQAAGPQTATATSPPIPASSQDEVSYNPRALLQSSTATIVSTIIPVTPEERQNVSSSTPALLDLRSDDHNSQ